MADPTEYIRRLAVAIQQSSDPLDRLELEKIYGQVWDIEQVSKDFEILGFMAPFVIIRRRSDKKRGSLEFQTNVGHRFYYNFKEK